MEISEKLQNQVRYFCDRISKVEWSGVLFYTTTGGNFGDADFKVVAEEVYLMDIDTPSFTSYKFDGPFVKMLMENPHLRSMQKAHLHSHATLSVFFSGTDTTEIIDNSKFHNYYLSLIVNNANDMTAKVAFRAKCTSVSRELEYRNIKGEMLVATINDNVNSETVLVYDCDITKPDMTDSFTRKRYKEIRAEKKIKNDLIQAAKKEVMKTIPVTTAIPIKNNRYPQDEIQPAYDLKQIREHVVNGNLFDSTVLEGKGMGSAADSSIRNWMIDVLNRGNDGTLLSKTLDNINKKKITHKSFKIDVFLEDVFQEVFEAYYRAFPEDPSYSLLSSRVNTACNMLNINYSEKYPQLVGKIVKILKSLSTYA